MIDAVVMVGEPGEGEGVEAWVQDARRQATFDLLEQLAKHPAVGRRILVTPDLNALEDAPFSEHINSSPDRVNVGNVLTEIVSQRQIQKLLYFGGGSAPLLEDDSLDDLISQMEINSKGVFTNNRFASDWAGLSPAKAITDWKYRLPLDNMIGWVMSTEAGLPCYTLPPSAGTRLDIDTPVDLLTLSLHPRVKRRTKELLDTLPLDSSTLRACLNVLGTPASHVFISGRISPTAWGALNEATTCWIRVLSEERGMVSSGRQENGEAYSLLAELIAHTGIQGFFQELSEYAQAAMIDTRVLLAHRRQWPSRKDRFYSDLGAAEEVEDPWLREFSSAARDSNTPIVLGGHGLLSGDILAFCDILHHWSERPS